MIRGRSERSRICTLPLAWPFFKLLLFGKRVRDVGTVYDAFVPLPQEGMKSVRVLVQLNAINRKRLKPESFGHGERS